MTTTSQVTILYVDGTQTVIPRPPLIVTSTRQQQGLVSLVLHGKSITVSADELQKAIVNALNVSR